MKVKKSVQVKCLAPSWGHRKHLIKVGILILPGSGAEWQPWPLSYGSCSQTGQDCCPSVHGKAEPSEGEVISPST